MGFRDFITSFGSGFRNRSGVGRKDLQIFYDQSTIPQNLRATSRTSGFASNVLMSPVMWVMRAVTEAQLMVQRRRIDQSNGIIWDRSIDHDMELLVDRPNDFYDGDALIKAYVLSRMIDGNAYWRKVRNAFGDVIQLWYVPHWMIKPVWPTDGSTFISHYEMNGGGARGPIELARRDVIHFRFGLDPDNPRLGYSPLKAILREVLTDDEAALFSEKILENMGVPGLIISPSKDAQMKPDSDQVKRLQEYFDNNFRGERRGSALVLGRPTDVHQFGFDPNKLMLPSLRDISEERVCAALGIPAAVVGFGSGLQSTKVGATMRELVKLAWVQCMTPMLTEMSRQLTAQLLPDFAGDRFQRTFRARFDTTEVAAFREEAAAEAQRVTLLVEKNVLRIDRAQQILGLEVDPSRAKYIDEITAAQTPNVAEEPDKPEDAEIVEDENDEEPSPADTQKLLRAIAHRNGFLTTTNGNGKH